MNPHPATLPPPRLAARDPATLPQTMLAIHNSRYAPIEALRLRRIPVPAPGKNEVLIRVHASALHVADCFAVRGSPLLVRAVTGLFSPRTGIPGFDVAGRVVALGPNATRFAVGDAVFGSCGGGCAQYTTAPEHALAPMPARLTFAQAAAVPTAALAALHALRDAAKLHAGQRILIIGASGGVGSFAVQIAKNIGAHVTGVCGPANARRVLALGADHVIDYTRDDFARGNRRYDVIFDNVENRSLEDCRRALTPNGTLILNSGTGSTGLRMLARLIRPVILSPFTRHTLRRYLSTPNAKDLATLKQWIDAGTLQPTIDRVHPLAQTADALRHIETGHASGRVVVSVIDDEDQEDGIAS